MDITTIENKIEDLLKANDFVDRTDNIDFKETLINLGIDSLDFINIVILCEREYDIHISDEYLINCNTLKDLSLVISKLVK